jgi:Mg2+-importing ATPase
MDTAAEQQVFQAVWFVEGILSRALVLLVLRPPRAPRPTRAIVTAAVAAGVLAAAVPFLPVGAAFDMTGLPVAALPWLAAIIGCYVLAVRATAPAYLRCTTAGSATARPPSVPRGRVRSR